MPTKLRRGEHIYSKSNCNVRCLAAVLDSELPILGVYTFSYERLRAVSLVTRFALVYRFIIRANAARLLAFMVMVPTSGADDVFTQPPNKGGIVFVAPSGLP